MRGKPPPATAAVRGLADPERVAVNRTVARGPSGGDVAAWTAALLAGVGASRASVSILLCGDARMRSLNRAWRKVDRPTDVLSFPAEPSHERGVRFLGDLAIDVPYAARKARRYGHGDAREVQILIAHGLLHLLGYDHETDHGEMFALQRRLVRRAFGPGPDGVPEDEPALKRRAS